MRFQLWSVWHYILILAPAISLLLLWLLLRKRSEKIKYIVGVVIGSLGLAVLLMRNLDILISNNWGFSKEVIPLQFCHLGNILVFIALVFKNKIAGVMAWSINLPAAFSAIIIADGLAGYANVFRILPQAYIWGHLFIIVGAIYFFMFYDTKIKLKDIFIALGIYIALLAVVIICNPLINFYTGQEANYFYIYTYKGSPFKFIYNLGTQISLGWFSINIVYTSIMFVIGFAIATLMTLLFVALNKYKHRQDTGVPPTKLKFKNNK